jgi:hypothetical protein
VASTCPKFTPLNTHDVYAEARARADTGTRTHLKLSHATSEVAEFAGKTSETTGASIEKEYMAVPATLPTVTMPSRERPVFADAGKHCALESELHDSVPQLLPPIALETLRSAAPKLIPNRVTELPSLEAALRGAMLVNETASNVNTPS